jgi:hypothetical protein
VAHRIEYSPLFLPTTRAEVAAFKAESKVAGRSFTGQSSGQLAAVIVGGLIVLIIGGLIGSALVGSAIRSLTSNGANPVAGVAIGFVSIVGLIAVGIVGYGIFTLVSGKNWEKWMRLSRFAAANNLAYAPSTTAPTYPGSIFSLGHSRSAYDHLYSLGGRFLEMGNYRYTTGSGKNSTTHTWGFLAFQLDRKLPHIMLDARANNGLFGGSNLPTYFAQTQKLRLEGDFNEHFTLYCPTGYERDALYIFTPDLMALLIDEAATFDVEIIDDWMFVYAAKPFNPIDPHVYQRLFRIIDTVGEKTLTQTDRYADERIGDPQVDLVAPQGARLKKGVSVGSVIAIVAFVAIWGWSFFGDLFG